MDSTSSDGAATGTGFKGIAARLRASFRARLITGILLLNVIVVTIAGLLLNEGYNSEQNRALTATQNMARLLARDLAGSFDKIDLVVRAVADEAERQMLSGGISKQAFNSYIDKQASRLPELDSLRMLDERGGIAYGPGLESAPHLNSAHRAFFMRLRDDPNAGLVVSEPMLGQVSGKWVITLARRVSLPKGKFGGVAFAVIFLETLQKRFSALELGARGAVSLRDLELATVVRHPEPNPGGTAVGNRTFSKEWPEKLKQDPVAGSYFAVGIDGRNRALSYRRIDNYPFYIVVGLFPDDYLGGWKLQAANTAALVIIFVVGSILFARLMARAWEDLTERKRAEKFLRTAYETEQQARAEAERIGHLKDEFLATVSHELRTPLTAIVGWSNILLLGNASGERIDHGLRVIERNAKIQRQMIDDLLDMRRIVSGSIKLDIQALELAAIVRDLIDTTRPAAEAKRISIEANYGTESAFVSGDPVRLQQILWNVLNNAVKFTPAGGRIEVSVERLDCEIQVTIRDSGPGMTAEFLPHAFERFRQAGSSHFRQSGLGLGLAIAKTLVELHGGSIRVDSAGMGHGSSFAIRFPILDSEGIPGDLRDGLAPPGGIPQPM
jgi:signal transduction histidine kinase